MTNIGRPNINKMNSCLVTGLFGEMKHSVIVDTCDWFGLVSLFNGISTFVGYLMPKPFS